jgi:hypothetical protein
MPTEIRSPINSNYGAHKGGFGPGSVRRGESPGVGTNPGRSDQHEEPREEQREQPRDEPPATSDRRGR